MREKPILSVGIPLFNEEKNIPKLYKSINHQTLKENIEIIISDNSSTDKTFKLLNKYFSKKKNIKIVRQKKNIGQAKNFSYVLNAAKGKYFLFHAGDDFLSNNYLENNLNFLSKNQGYVSSAGLTKLKNKNIKFKLKKGNFERIKLFFKYKWVSHGIIYGIMKKKDLLNLKYIFQQENYLAKDWLIDLCLLNKGKFNRDYKSYHKIGEGLSYKKNAIQLQLSNKKKIRRIENFFPLYMFLKTFLFMKKDFSLFSQIYIIYQIIKLSIALNFKK